MSSQAEMISDDSAYDAVDRRNKQLIQEVAQLKKSLADIPPQALSIQQCAAGIGVSVPTWYKLRKSGLTPQTFQIDGIKRQFVLTSVYEKWVKEKLSKMNLNKDIGSPAKIKFEH